MFKKITIETILSWAMLIFAVGFNLWLYKLEPTATIDPNDNAFQFALVDRTNTMWTFASKTCSSSIGNLVTYPICVFSYLGDHWVPNWAEGFNLPFYYSHAPQILIVGTWRIIHSIIGLFGYSFISLFMYYHIIIYLLMCLFPISVFAAFMVMDFPPLTAGVGAIFAMNLSTDGLYGLDPSSFLWRGYGLSSQLFAMIWLPLAIAYAWKFLQSEGDGTQFFRDLVSHAKQVISDRSGAGHHVATEKTSNDLENVTQASRKNSSTGSLLLAIFFLTATTAGHLGIGMIGMLSVGFLALAKPIIAIVRQHPIGEFFDTGKDQILRLILICGITIFILSYWIIPVFLYANYHNLSFWDPVWKFNSYGAKETFIRLFNGDLFDFGRPPVITYLTILGVIIALYGAGRKKFADETGDGRKSIDEMGGGRKNDGEKTKLSPASISLEKLGINEQMRACPERAKRIEGRGSEDGSQFSYASHYDISPLAFLFIFWILFYFGRTTWGGLIDLIPGMVDFHLSRFLVGIHVAGMLLAPIGFVWLAESGCRMTNVGLRKLRSLRVPNWFIRLFVYLFIGLLLIPPVYQWTITYNSLNNYLIVRADKNHAAVASDEAALVAKLQSLETTKPGRVFAGRGGGFGKNFKVAETPYFMDLSTYGLPTTLWLPETWSMDSDTEQYFSEDQAKDYDLYNMRWVAAPPDQTPYPFWKLVDQRPTWKLYEVHPELVEGSPMSGYFTVGVRPATVAITKTNFMTAVHLWIQSNMHKYGIFPELTFDKSYPHATGIPNFKMLDEVTYQTPDGSTHNLFSQPPVYLPPGVKSLEQFNTLMKKAGDSVSDVTKYYLPMKLVGPEVDDTDMIFKTTVEVGNNCTECMVILKQSYHPEWRAWVDGKPVKPIIVFPFYIGIPMGAPGIHTIELKYQPSILKMGLLYLTILTLLGLVGYALFRHCNCRRGRR